MKKTEVFSLTETGIREMVSSKIFNRGLEYFKEKAVCHIYSTDNVIEAHVEGTDDFPYKVQIEFDKSGLKGEPFCSCPYAEDFNEICKHIVAVLLTVLKKPKTVKAKKKLSDILKTLDKTNLIQLIETVVKTNSSLNLFVEDLIKEISQKTIPDKKSKINSNKYKKEAIRIVRSLNGLSSSEAYWLVSDVVRDIQNLIKKARPFLDRGNGETAISILTGIAEGYIQEWTCLDGSDGETPNPFYDLDEGFAEALLVAEIPENIKEPLKTNIEKWVPDLEDYDIDDAFSVTLSALKEGWSDENIVKALKGELKAKPTTKAKGEKKDDFFFWREPANRILSKIRLNILKREKKFDEYMNLALAEGLVTQYLLMKIERGNIKEAVDKGRTIITKSEEAHEISKKLKEVKAFKEALEIGAMGLEFSDFKAEFGDHISELAEKMNKKPLALQSIQKSFFKNPTLKRYNRTWKLADKKNTKRIKADYLKFLRTPNKNLYDSHEEKINIFLQEALFNDAIKEARHIDSQSFLMKIMSKVLTHNPDWVITESKKRAMSIIHSGEAKNYDLSVDWLKWTKKGYVWKKQLKKWNESLKAIKLKHKPKRKLMGLLEKNF